MSEKTLKGRVIQKHDIATNWDKATGFIPKKGEIIIYDVDDNYSYERVKVGDGVQNVTALPFVTDALEAATNEQITLVSQAILNVASLVGDTAVSEQIANAIAEIPEQVQVDWNQNDVEAVDYIENRPFYDTIKTELIYVSSSNQPKATTLSNGLYYGTTTGSSTTLQSGSRYKITINIGGYSSTIFTCTTAKVVDAYQYCRVLGNAQLGVDVGFLDGNNSNYPITDTGENFCFLSYSSTAKNAIISTNQNAQISAFYTVTGDLKQIDEKFIPNTIAKVSDISNALSAFESGMTLKNTTIALPESDSWMDIAYGNGKYVAISNESDVAAYSIDGMNWTATTMPRSGAWRSVIYADGKFVAVCAQYGLSQAAYSTDGINWTMSNLSLSNGASSYDSYSFVAYGEGRFVIVSNSNGYAAYSTDGITWTNCTTPPTIACKAVTYGNDVFVAIPTHGSTASYSRDGIVWHSSTVPSATYHNLAYGNGKFVATYLNSNTSVLCAIYSTDGINWNSVNIGSSTSYYDGICYGNNKFVAVATYGNSVIYSEDGMNWYFTNMVEGNNWCSVCYTGDKFVAVAWGGKVAHSSDGITWSDQRQFISQNSVDITENVTALTQRRDVYTQAQVNALIAAVKEACMPKVTTVTLFTDEWFYGEGEYYYDVKLNCITSNSQVNLQADATSLAILQDDGIALVPITYNSFVRIWTVGGSPREDLTVQITVQEVMEV